MDKKSVPIREEHPIVSVILLSTGLGIMVGSFRYGFGSFERPGAGFLPFFAGLSFALFEAITLLRILRHGWRSLRETWRDTQWQRALFVTLTLMLYSTFLSSLGFLLSTILLMVFLLRLLEPPSWKSTLFAAFAITAVFYFIFQICLKAQLPLGFMGI